MCGAAGDRGIAYLRFPLPPQAIRHGVLVLNSVSGTGTVSVHVVDAKAVGTWSEADLRWWHRLPVGPALGVLQQVDGQWRLQLDGLQGTEVELALLSDSATPIVFFSRESGRRGPCLVFETDDGSAAVRNADF